MGDFDAMEMLAGRSGRAAHRIGDGVGANRPGPQPYRPELAHEEFVALGDNIVCVEVNGEEASPGGILIPTGSRAPYMMVQHVGPKAAEVVGHPLAAGDLVFAAGSHRVDTTAGTVHIVPAKDVKALILKKPPVSEEGA